MAGVWTKKFSFGSGAVRSKDHAYVISTQDSLAKDQVPHASILEWYEGEWSQEILEFSLVSVCVVSKPKEQMLAIGEGGEAQILGSGDFEEETVADGKIKPAKRGTLRCVRAIDGLGYAAGMDRQVYQRSGADRWECIDEGMRPPADNDDVVGFESIDGFDAKNIFCAGWQGSIWHYDGTRWTELDSPTNVILTNVCCAGDGNVYACGRRGMLLRGGTTSWEVIDHGKTRQDLWGLAWFKDRLYVASNRQVFTLEGNTLSPVRMGDDPAESAYHLSAADGVLWSFGAKDIVAFNGKEWSRIE